MTKCALYVSFERLHVIGLAESWHPGVDVVMFEFHVSALDGIPSITTFVFG